MNTAEALLFASDNQNDGIKLIQKNEPDAVYTIKNGFIYNPCDEAISGYWHTVIGKTEWEVFEKKPKGVTWKEAFEAGLQGKNIKVYGQFLTYPQFKPLWWAMNYLAARPGYYKSLMAKEWFIEE